MIAVILGPDYALARAHLKTLLRERDPDGTSTTTMDGKTSSMNDVLMAATSVGFFSAGRLVVVEDLIARLGKQGAKENGAAPDWGRLLGAIPEASTLVLFDPSVASVPAAVKKALPADALVQLGDPPRGQDLLRWIASIAQREGAQIDQGTARRLAETMYPQSWGAKGNNPAFDRPPDLEIMEHEIAKLAVAAHPGAITERHIRELVAQGDDDKLFGFIDAAVQGNLPRALVELNRLLDAGEDPFKLLSQLGQQIELSVVMAAAPSRVDPLSVGKDLGLSNPNRMKAIAMGVSKQGRGLPSRSVNVLETIDYRLKTGELRDPVDALYVALAGIAQQRRSVRS